MLQKIVLFCCCTALVLISCKSTSTQIEVLQPAEIFIPENIETIVTIDRSKPAKGFGSFLEAVITGEGIGQDKEGRRQALNGLTEALTRTPRFNIIHSGYEKTGSNASLRLIEPMNWYEIKALCEEFEADAVLAIEMFDSDVALNLSEKERKRKNKDGEEYLETYFQEKMDLSIQMGWRLYDPQNRLIIDEFTTRDDGNDQAEGKTKEEVRRKLTDPYEMARGISFEAGRLYGERIAPTWVMVSRGFYRTVKGPDAPAMEKASRRAETKDWKGAASIWQDIINTSADRETRGKAAYNIAIANESLGKLQNARDWAQKAYVDFGNKKAKNYIQTIENRIYEQQLVEEQLKGRN